MTKKLPRHVPFSPKKLKFDLEGKGLSASLKTLLGEDEAAYEQFLERKIKRLYDFTVRELEYHDMLNQLTENELDPHDIINEAVARIIEKEKKPQVKLGRQLYKEVLDVLHEQVNKLEERERREVSIEENIKDPSQEAGFRTLGEHVLDFWHPDQDLTALDFIADREVPTPVEIQDMKARQKEIYDALDSLPQEWRENFILLAIERWPVGEIAEMREQPKEKINEQLRMSQAFLQERLRDRLLLRNRPPRQGPHVHERG